MVNYKLVYFDSRGWAETARILLHHEGIEFEDVRIPREEWPGEHKAKAPFGHLPYLEVDGKKLPESYAIHRYLARQFGLAGKDEWEQAWVDSIADMFKDIMADVGKFFLVAVGRFEGDKDKLQKEVFQPAVDRLLSSIVQFLKDSGSGFVVMSGYTWVDFLLADALISIENLVPGSVDSNAEVKAYKERVLGLPKIKNYIVSRKVLRW